MSNPATVWSADRIDQLTELFHQGFSCAQIAAKLGERTRNGVIGKLNRLGLKRGHKNPPARQKGPRAPRTVKTEGQKIVRVVRSTVSLEPNVAPVRCAEVVPLHISFSELADDQSLCTYAYGEQTPFTFCGRASVKDLSFCQAHYTLTHGPGSSSERKAISTITRKMLAA